MFSHVMLGVNDVPAAKIFYDAVLGALGYEPGVIDDKGRCFYRTPVGVFGVTKPLDGNPATPANGGTISFWADSPAAADAWHSAGVANGGITCEDPPGARGGPTGSYLAYLRDPTGNKICVKHLLS